MAQTIKFKRGTAAAIAAANPTPAAGEPIFETDTKKFKLGDGETPYTQLPYQTNETTVITEVDGGVIEAVQTPAE